MSIKLPKKDDVAIDMAPMIDMVFLLLIFFMVASVVTVTKVKVEIPKAVHSKVPKETKDRMMLSVDANNNIYVNMTKLDDVKELTELVSAELDLTPDLRILIRSDAAVEYKTNKDIMSACAAAGATDLIYATFEADE